MPLLRIAARRFAGTPVDPSFKVAQKSMSLSQQGLVQRSDKVATSAQQKVANEEYPNFHPQSGELFTEQQVARGLGGAKATALLGEKGEGAVGGPMSRHAKSNEGYVHDWRYVFGDSDNNWFGMYTGTLKKQGGGFGHPWDMTPAWITKWEDDAKMQHTRDRFDFIIRGLNRTRFYENFLKTFPMYCSTLILVAIVGGWQLDRFWEWMWIRNNRGKLYFENPYVYPPEDD